MVAGRRAVVERVLANQDVVVIWPPCGLDDGPRSLAVGQARREDGGDGVGGLQGRAGQGQVLRLGTAAPGCGSAELAAAWSPLNVASESVFWSWGLLLAAQSPGRGGRTCKLPPKPSLL